MSMSEKRFTEIVEAMIAASGLSPDYENDYYGDSSAVTRANLINGLIIFFGQPRDSNWITSHNSMEWIDTPSETVDYLTRNRKYIWPEYFS